MKHKAKLSRQIREFWFRRRWIILAVAGFLSAFFEFIEFVREPTALRNPQYVVEMLLQGAVIPFLLVTLHQTEAQKNLAVNNLSYHNVFVNQLNNAKNWDELIEIIGQFPRNILPLSGVCLLIRTRDSNQFVIEFSQSFDMELQMVTSPNSPELREMKCRQWEFERVSGLELCNCLPEDQTGQKTARHHRYCLPLTEGNSVLGLLHLYLPIPYRVSKAQKDFLQSVRPEIALSINEANLKRKETLQQSAIEAERRHLASDLHDTLGQDLAYLRNKIDQVIQEQTFRKPAMMKQELGQMRLAAEEANQAVRNLLTTTYPNQITPLDARLFAYAKGISERSNFAVSLESNGISKTLDPHVQFQIFLIFREILANIEKHANAQQVTIALNWSDEELTMVISDDGRGFQPDHLNNTDHFGLAIIETRTRELFGNVSIASAPKQGTQVSVWLPLIHLQHPAGFNSVPIESS